MLSLTEKARLLIRGIEDRSFGLISAYAKSLSEAELAGFIMVAENLDKVLGVTERAGEAVGTA